MGGWKQLLLLPEREWLLARLGEKLALAFRGLGRELAERGRPASYGAVWRFFKHEGITFKKKPARQRAGSSRRGVAARPVEAASGPA
jgi:transposase